MKRAGGDIWDPRNGLTLCASCHAKHHNRSRVLPVSMLRPENIAYIRELLGEAADNYLARYYRG